MEDFEKLRAALEEIQEGKNLDQYINDPDMRIRSAVADQNYGLDTLCHDSHPLVRKHLADTGKCLDILVNDELWYIRFAVAEQNYGLEQLANDPSPMVAAVAEARLRSIAQKGGA